MLHIAVDDGCRIACHVDGPEDVPAVVFAHSLGASSAMWEPQLAALQGRYRVIRYDSRGHGASDVPAGPYTIERLGRDVLAIADALGLDQFAYCGLSLGGMVGQWLGVHAADRINKLILCNTTPYMGPPEVWQERIDTVRREGMGVLVEGTLGRWFTPAFHASHPEIVEAVRRRFLATSPEGYAACAAAIMVMDQRGLLGRITCPTLIVGGHSDPSTPPACAEEMHQAIAGSLLILIDAAHVSNIEAEDAFNAALSTFLE